MSEWVSEWLVFFKVSVWIVGHLVDGRTIGVFLDGGFTSSRVNAEFSVF